MILPPLNKNSMIVKVKARIPEAGIGEEIELSDDLAKLYKKRGRVDIISVGEPEDITTENIEDNEQVDEVQEVKAPIKETKPAAKKVSKAKSVVKKRK